MGFSVQIVETVDVIGGDYLWQVSGLCSPGHNGNLQGISLFSLLGLPTRPQWQPPGYLY